MKKVKKVLIYAYTSINLGDDLFIKILCDRYPDVQFILQGRKYKKIFRNQSNLKCCYTEYVFISMINKMLSVIGFKNKIPKIKEKILLKKVDAAVYIGGSIFIQTKDWYEQYFKLKERVFSRTPFYIIGCNFGPYKDEAFYNAYKDLFGHCKDVCFRENYSYDLFKDMNIVRKSDDIVFGLTAIPARKSNNIVISLINLENRNDICKYENSYIRKIADLCHYIINQGDTVTLMSFCKLEGDEGAINKVLNLIGGEKESSVKTYYYSGNINESLMMLSKSKMILATRFHAMILGFVLGIPVFPIIYSNKMRNVLNDIGFTGKSVGIEEIDKVVPKEIYNIDHSNIVDISIQKNNAQKQFQELDKYLKEKTL